MFVFVSITALQLLRESKTGLFSSTVSCSIPSAPLIIASFIDVTLAGICSSRNLSHCSKILGERVVTFFGKTTDSKFVHPENAYLFISLMPTKYCSSLNAFISVFPLNISPRLVTAAASALLSSPSPLVSQFATQISLTFESANVMFSISIISLNSFQMLAAAYAALLPAGT